MIFFDSSYVDLTFRTRLHRQRESFQRIEERIWKVVKEFFYSINVFLYRIKRRLSFQSKRDQKILDQKLWAGSLGTATRMSNSGKEDLTVDGYIGKYGGIKSSLNEKVYTSKAAYMDHIKASGKVIKDW